MYLFNVISLSCFSSLLFSFGLLSLFRTLIPFLSFFENFGSFFIHFLLPSLLYFFRSCVLYFSLSIFLCCFLSLSLSLSAGRRGGSAPPGSLSLSLFLSLSLSIALNSLIVLDAYLSFLDAYLIFCRCLFNFFKAYPHPVRNLLNPETPKSSTAYLAS